ncbi:hypothetical protein H6A11_00525 [Bifidobacterium pullorum subsp. saeculare]|uniref:hypothetical protein n=1 Tax=Bifidobacterium pullorum TaxID=78448 RepID=UPI0019586089|nr:hypothetical protein [Bifidobacterium pullorum]MBM6695537.1 hypothetical protein [Bifidobacterium pullorum subsp. saeculare]
MTNTKNNPPQAATDIAGGVNGYTPSYPQHATDQLLFLLLDRISAWLLGYAYGDFRETVSPRCRMLADMMALTVYASAIAPVPMSFGTLGEDLPARRMLDAAASLIPGCHVRMCPASRPTAHTDISTDATDKLTAQIAELPLLPALAVSDRGTAATLRRDIIADAEERRAHILSNGKQPAQVVHSVARIAGVRWPRVSELLLKFGTPLSNCANGKEATRG